MLLALNHARKQFPRLFIAVVYALLRDAQGVAGGFALASFASAIMTDAIAAAQAILTGTLASTGGDGGLATSSRSRWQHGLCSAQIRADYSRETTTLLAAIVLGFLE
jgi:hypothetical protein